MNKENIPLSTDFLSLIQKDYPSLANKIIQGLDTEALTSIRYNTLKNKVKQTSLLSNQNVQWCDNAYYLEERPFFAHDPLWHLGYYYVQEAGSMALAQIQRFLPNKALRVLDLSAAPGGKSTLLQTIVPKGSTLIANEPIPKRAQILAENLIKWGNPNTIVTQSFPNKLAQSGLSFDLIVVDAPCSGEGLFRKTPEARNEWSLNAVNDCAQRQKDILHSAWKMLECGGLLCYCTCTFNSTENEDNVKFLIDTHDAELIPLEHINPSWNWVQGKESLGYHLIPNITASEGFYFALLQKKGSKKEGNKKNKKEKRLSKKEEHSKILDLAKKWLKESCNSYIVLEEEEKIALIPPSLQSQIQALQKESIPILTAGIPFAEKKGKKIAPSPLLVYSSELNVDKFPSIPLPLKETLNFFAGDSLQNLEDIPLGYALVTFQGLAMGFVNNLGNRANNLYPKNFRLKVRYTE